MQIALNILGIPCYHGFTLVANTQDCALWDRALDAKFFHKGSCFTREQWDQLLGAYGAVADLPAIAFAEDFIDIYPESKVVLVERDIEKWYQSFDDVVMESLWNPISRIVARLDTHFAGQLGGVSNRWARGWMEANSLKEMRDKARPKYREHYSLIERVTPPERLLKFDLKDGWKPLCNFLQKPVPDVPFPRVNEAAALKEEIEMIKGKVFKNALLSRNFILFTSVVGIAVAGLAWALRK
ncbi:hypothetical protein MMC10_000123 [Thelotrema lepadinum]|nr:hypothetical protein [Thelotrema lepadinum]